MSVQTLMYTGNRSPWGGFGTYVGDDDVDSKTAITKAGLDWDVNLQRLFTSPDGVDVQEVITHKAIVRSDNKKTLGVVGGRYHPVQNKEAFEFMDSLVETGKMKYHTAGSLRGGQRIWLLGKIGDSEVVPQDKLDHYLFLYNTHDGSNSLRVLFTTIRLICTNIAQAILSSKDRSGVHIRHTKSIKERMIQADQILGISNQKFTDFNTFAQNAANLKLTATMWDEFTKTLIPDPPPGLDVSKKLITVRNNTREQLTDLYHNGVGQNIPGVAGTGWAAYNAVVEYSNYIRGTRGDAKQEKRFESSMLGGSSKLINQAIKEIIQIAA